ncbi:MAG: chemotaxis response regulator protein-glutamate methylesterase [Azospira sp.]|jgi:two-component system chemotaxis response regulator CheB|nr:chemotaxis response regulator protein-glutamate methylesterase [Azospira sp.]
MTTMTTTVTAATNRPLTSVLVVDDSAAMRKLLAELINAAPGLRVVGTAPDAQTAREMIKTLNPDVLTLDVQMPRMDGLEFLERLMRLRPTRVVMVSAFTEAGSETTLRALELGAIDFIGKPRADSPAALAGYGEELAEKIRAAAAARLSRPELRERPVPPLAGRGGNGTIICVGASTGGTEAIKTMLQGFPADCPPTLIVQHMPETFTGSFARRLDTVCPPRVIEASGGERLEAGTVYLAPGHSHLMLRRQGAGFVTELSDAAPVNRHRPSVDVLFDSAARLAGAKAVGVILTGMGRDGAQGLLRMRQAGARTFGQDEASCVVYGMPREAAQIGAVEEVLPLDDMARRVLATAARAVA